MSLRGKRGMLEQDGRLLAGRLWWLVSRLLQNDGVWWAVLFILAAASSHLLLQTLTPRRPVGFVYRLTAGGLAVLLPMSLTSILAYNSYPGGTLRRGAVTCAVYGMGGFVVMYELLLLEVAFPGFLKSAAGAFWARQVGYAVFGGMLLLAVSVVLTGIYLAGRLRTWYTRQRHGGGGEGGSDGSGALADAR